jgi:hypothetical protein
VVLKPRVSWSPTTPIAQPRLRVKYLYSGREDNPEGVIAMLRDAGHTAEGADIVNNIDLLNDSVWAKIMADIKDYDFLILTPPCGTFAASRDRRPGPRPLRSGAEPYGFAKPIPPFTAAEKLAVREANIHSVKSWILFKAAVLSGLGVLFEAPTVWKDGQPSSFQFNEAKETLALPGVADYECHQCPFGASSMKPTTFRIKTNGSSAVVTTTLVKWCNHDEHWIEYTDASGDHQWIYAAHAPLVGRKVSGQWATSAAETYTKQLIAALVAVIVDSGKRPHAPLKR